MAETIIVYSPAGAPEKHTRPNARDLVNGSGYTWHPGKPTTPASIAPFATFNAPSGPAPSQKVLDSVGGSGGGAAASAAQQAAAAQAAEMARLAAAQDEAPAAPVTVDLSTVKDFSQAPAEDASDLDSDPDADEPAAAAEDAAPRRGRRPKA